MTTAWRIIRAAALRWFDDEPFHMAASIAYYTLFSLAPLLVIVVALAGGLFGEEAVRGEIVARTRAVVGEAPARVIASAIRNATFDPSGPFATVASALVLLLGATAVFAELQRSLNRIWRVDAGSANVLLAMLRRRLVAIAMILVLGFLLLVSLIASAVLAAVAAHVGGFLRMPALVLEGANFVFAFAVTAMLFAVMYKVLPEAEIGWREAGVGAAVTAALFTAGKAVLGTYIGWSGLGSTYGAAGSVVMLLAWVYYSTLIVLFGAEFTHVYGRPLHRKGASP